MLSNEKPLWVAIIGAMGLVIAALITSGYFHKTSAAKREDVLEERVRILEAELRKQQIAAQAQTSRSNETSSPPSLSTAADPVPAAQTSRDLNEVASSLAKNENAQILATGASAKGMLAENATKTYVFIGTANIPLLFTLNQPHRNFWSRFDILDSQGNPLVRNNSFSNPSTDYAFTPPKDDAYVLRITGHMGYGDYVLVVNPLDNGVSNP
jgi:hypothetical protein